MRPQIPDLQPLDRQNQASRFPSAPFPQEQESGFQPASTAPSPPTVDEAPSQLGEVSSGRSDPTRAPDSPGSRASPARRTAAVLYRVHPCTRPRRPGVQVGPALGRPLPRSRLSRTPAAAQALAIGSLHPLTPAPSAGIPGAAAEGGPRRSGPKGWGRSSGGSRAQEMGSGWALLWGHFLAPIPSQRCPRPYTLILTSLEEFVQAGTRSSLNLNPFPTLI